MQFAQIFNISLFNIQTINMAANSDYLTRECLFLSMFRGSPCFVGMTGPLSACEPTPLVSSR